MFRVLVGILMFVGVSLGNLHSVQADPIIHAVRTSNAPVSKFSSDWAITFTGHGDLHSGREDIRPCNFVIVNKGQLVSSVTVELYRPLANDKSLGQVMIAGTINETSMKTGQKITLENFPVSNTVEHVEFVITWKLDGRKYKQSLFFKQNELK